MKPLIYVVVAVLAGAAGFFIYKSTLDPVTEPVAASAPAAPSASVEPQATPESTAPGVIPDFTLVDLEGTPRSIRSWTDKALIVNFWATWCAPCRREIPLLNEIQKTNGPAGFQVVGVAVDVREDVQSYAKEIGFQYPVIQGEQEAMAALGKLDAGFGLPVTIFTDNQHRVVLTHMGELHKPQAEVILAIIARVNSGELTPAAGRTMAAAQLQDIHDHDA